MRVGDNLKKKVDNFEMYYEDEGKGSPIVFIHGMGGDTSEWRPIKPYISKEARFIAMDLRGHGNSERPEGAYTQSLFSNDVALLLDELGVDRAYICGLSMGGIVTQYLALDHPGKVKGAILVDTTPCMLAETAEMSSKWFKDLQERGKEAYIETEIKDVFHPMFIRRHPKDVEMFKGYMRERDNLETMNRINKGFEEEPFDLRERLRNIKVPTLIVHGEDDKVIPKKMAELMKEKIPNSCLAIVPFCGHVLPWHVPEYFTDLVMFFASSRSD
jgi:pimeloyl-ACP methyl ester carboxylesterase